MATGTNLAAIGWEEFEHLIRELFEKEFSGDGGEVKITRASRDGGVDAIAFDPDPIRGRKIVIQAKRYTNTVDGSRPIWHASSRRVPQRE
jgi:restriction system protein